MPTDEGVHYHHIAGMGGGYMPDDHGLYSTFDEAVSAVENDIARDTDNDPELPVREFTRVVFDTEQERAFWEGYFPTEASPHDLGWYFEIFRVPDWFADHEDCRAILNGEKEYPLV